VPKFIGDVNTSDMLDEITPAIRPLKEVKIIGSANCMETEELPIESKISFLPFIRHIKEKSADTSDIRSRFYKYLADKFEDVPDLLQPIGDLNVLSENYDLLELLTTSLFPLVSDQEKIFTLALPFRYSIFNFSQAFGKLFVDDHQQRFLLAESETTDALKKLQCMLIYEHVLEKFYNIRLNENTQIVVPVTDAATGMKRYFKLRYDRRFIDIRAKGELPNLRDCAVCMNSFRILDLDVQKRSMPISNFVAEGFGVWVAEDVTTHESIEAIKKILLRHETCDTGIISEVKRNVHALVGISEVEVGFTPFMKLNNRFVLDESCTQHSMLGRSWKQDDEESMAAYNMGLEMISQHPEPTAFTKLDEFVTEQIPLFRKLWEDGTRSYIIYPIIAEDGLLGLLELASPIESQLDLEVVKRLEPAMPLLSLALLKTRNTFNERIEKLIKENFTALQPSVEWKFAEAAWESMYGNHDEVPRSILKNVVFENVYPLYGAIDIRNSSIERSFAIQKDLNEHLNLIDRTLDELYALVKLPLLDGLKFKVQNFRKSIEKGLAAEDEIRFNEFYEKELSSILRHLQNSDGRVMGLIAHYFNEVEEENSSLHKYRNEYEETMQTINEAVMRSIIQEEMSIQQSYPHYFEKYKTDGVEYTIYIGQSIAPDNKFDLMYLQNLRLWQISSMAEVARITHGLLNSLKVPLRTTQLILVHSQPISIGFRKDERRFDVEGAYNIRYEMMKKRLDKVHINGTNERLTQPEKIAIVYSNPKEAQEYQEYIFYLQSKDLLKPGIENLELEELQGVRGLKALRVDVNLEE
jgi:hypothetical protein